MNGRCVVACVIGVCALTGAAREAQGLPSYEVVGIPAQPGHEYMNIAGLNNSGEVLADSFTLEGDWEIAPFVWSPANGTRLLDTGGYWAAYAGAFNDLGQAVGDPDTIWNSNGDATSLGFSPHQINNNGLVFGTADIPGPQTMNHPVIWSESGGRIDIPSNGPGQYTIYDSNDAGVGVGSRWVVTNPSGEPGDILSENFPVLITTDGIVEPALLPGYRQGSIGAINNDAMMIGYSSDGVSSGRATVWMPDGTLIDLGPGVGVSDLNNLGQVLGNGPDGPFLWTADGGFAPIDLPMDFGDDALATKLNDLGQIVIGDWVDTPNHYYLLTPIPAPGAFALALFAGVAVIRRGRNLK